MHSTITSASDVPVRAIKCCSVVFGVTLRLFVINISSSSLAINKLRRLLLPAISLTNLPRSGGTVFITPRRSQHCQYAMKRDTGRLSRFLPTPHAVDALVGGGGPVGILSLCLVRKNTNESKLNPFSFKHNCDKNSPILIILSLLQSINCD